MTNIFTRLINEREIEIAIKLLKKGLSLEDIADTTELGIDIIRELQEQQEKEQNEGEEK